MIVRKMSKERFKVFATDVETGESRSTTQYLHA